MDVCVDSVLKNNENATTGGMLQFGVRRFGNGLQARGARSGDVLDKKPNEDIELIDNYSPSAMDDEGQSSLKALFAALKTGTWGSIFNALAHVPLDERPQVLIPTTIFYAQGRAICGYFSNKDNKLVKLRPSKNDTWFVSNSWWKTNPNAQEDNRATAYGDSEMTTAASVHSSQLQLPLAIAIPTTLRGSANDFSEDWFDCLLGEKLQFCLQNSEMSRESLTRISGMQQVCGGKTGMMQIYCCSYAVAASDKKPNITYTRRMQQLEETMASSVKLVSKKNACEDDGDGKSSKPRSIVIRCSNPSINAELKRSTISLVLHLQKLFPILRISDINVYFYVDGSGQAWLCHTSAISFIEKSSGPTALKFIPPDIVKPLSRNRHAVESGCLGDFCKLDTNESKWFNRMTPEPKELGIWTAQVECSQQIMYKSVVMARLESKFWSESQAKAYSNDDPSIPQIFGSLYQYSIQQLTQWINVCSTCAKRYHYLDELRLEKQSNISLGASHASVVNTAIIAKLKEDLSPNPEASDDTVTSGLIQIRKMKCRSASRLRSRYPFFLVEENDGTAAEQSPIKSPQFSTLRTDRRPSSGMTAKSATSDSTPSRWQYSYKKQAKQFSTSHEDTLSTGKYTPASSTGRSTPAALSAHQSPYNTRPQSAATSFTGNLRASKYPTASNFDSLGARPTSADGVYYSANAKLSMLMKPFPELVPSPVIVRLDRVKMNWQDSLRSPMPSKKGLRPHADILDMESSVSVKNLVDNSMSHFKYDESCTMPFRIIRDNLASVSAVTSTMIMISDIMSSMTDMRDSAEIFVTSCRSYQVVLVNIPGQEFSSFDDSQCNNNEYQSFQLTKFLNYLEGNGVFPKESYVAIDEQKRVPSVDIFAIGFAAAAVAHLTNVTQVVKLNSLIMCNPILRMNNTISANVSAWCSSAEASQFTGCDIFGRTHAHTFFSSRYLELSSSGSLDSRDYRPIHLRLPHILPSSATLAGLINLCKGAVINQISRLHIFRA
jgi:hypothetical protein